jgi:hypothetical protein
MTLSRSRREIKLRIVVQIEYGSHREQSTAIGFDDDDDDDDASSSSIDPPKINQSIPQMHSILVEVSHCVYNGTAMLLLLLLLVDLIEFTHHIPHRHDTRTTAEARSKTKAAEERGTGAVHQQHRHLAKIRSASWGCWYSSCTTASLR